MATKKGASLNPVDFITGGLLDDADVTFKNVKFEMFDYDGKAEPAPALGIDLVTGAEEEGAKPYRQHWSCGSSENWEPSDDGSTLVPIGKDTELRKATNLYMFLTSLKEAQFPMERLNDGDCSVLEGLQAHVLRKDAPKRGNLPQGGTRRGRDGKEYEKDNKVLCVSKINKFPWEGEAPAKPKKGAAKKEEPAAEAGGGDIEAKAKDVLIKLVVSGDGKALVKEVPSKGFALIDPKDPDKNKILKVLFNPAWIKANGFNVTDDGVITLG